MLTVLGLAMMGLVLFVARHHARAEVFIRRSFLAHVSEMFLHLPRHASGVAIMGIGLIVFLSVFYPAGTVLALCTLPPSYHVPILIVSTLFCAGCGFAAPLLMIFVSSPIGFGISHESTPLTFIFYAIPGFLYAAAAYFLTAIFFPALRFLP